MIALLLFALAASPKCTHDRCTVTITSTVASEAFKPSYRIVLSDGRTYRDTQPVFTFSVMGPDSLKATAYATTTAGASRQKAFTIYVPSPPPVRQIDTVLVTRVDSILVLPPGVTVVNDNGEVKVYLHGQFIGRLVFGMLNTVDAIAAPTPGDIVMHRLGTYASQPLAIAALIRGTP